MSPPLLVTETGGKRTLQQSVPSGIKRGMNRCSPSIVIRSIIECVTLALVLSVAAPLAAQDAPLGTETWKSSCDAQACLIVGDVSHGDEASPRHMFIDVALQRGGKVESITFRLPPDADKGKLFAVGFADSAKDASGNWNLKLVANSTRILNVQNCAAACVVTLPNGIISAQDKDPAFDVGQAMAEHNLMLMFYFDHGERIRASAALFRFRDVLDSAKRQLP